MLEKLLRKFISEDAKLVLAAMEKWMADKDLGAAGEADAMYDCFMHAANRLDKVVVSIAHKRLTHELRQKRNKKRATEIAGQILMGETFENSMQSVGRSGVGQQIQQQAYQQVQQAYQVQIQQTRAQQNQMLGGGTGLLGGQASWP